MTTPQANAEFAEVVTGVTQYYNREASTYFEKTKALDMGAMHAPFLAQLPKNSLILDAGCGSGRDSLAFLQAGYQVHAFDASSALVGLAREHTGIHVSCHTFADVHEVEQFDGIWACASLVHLDEPGLQEALRNLARALKKGGCFFLSMKKGEGFRRAGDGRVFYDFTLPRLLERPELQGLTPVWSQESLSTLGNADVWLSVILRKRLI